MGPGVRTPPPSASESRPGGERPMPPPALRRRGRRLGYILAMVTSPPEEDSCASLKNRGGPTVRIPLPPAASLSHWCLPRLQAQKDRVSPRMLAWTRPENGQCWPPTAPPPPFFSV